MKKISRKFFSFIRDFVRILLIILIFFTIYNFWYINQQRDYYQQYITHSTELRVLAQQIAKYAGEAIVTHREDTFKELDATYASIESEINILKNGKMEGDKVILPPSPEKIKIGELNRFSDTWDLIKSKVRLLIENQVIIVSLGEISDRIVSNIEKIQALYRDVMNQLATSSNVENKNIIAVSNQNDLGENLKDNLQSILTISGDSANLEKTVTDGINSFFENAKQIQSNNSDPKFTQIFSDVSKALDQLQADVVTVGKTSGLVDKLHAAIVEIFNISPLMATLSGNLEDVYINYPKTNTVLDITAYVLGLLSFVVLILMIMLIHKENEYHLKLTEDKNKAMQLEVEELLKELPEIANGTVDLEKLETAKGPDTSGMIAESFAYALNTLRKLVFSIGKTAQNVSRAALDAQKITKELADSSANQAQEIVEVTASVNAMAISIEQVSTNAAASAAVALESVNIAGEGGKVVRSTISGMERIQTQIQETSNYMRRLSDSSQEIGEIVSLIDGIADQTNILSLNASIQAAMAGEAGRGFAVVADEVQRLAEKVSYATKEIGSLVRSIQTDTGQVIGAMEQTKAQVLEGVNSAQDAGSTLEKIETVSRRLSDLIQNISASASEQANVSGKISGMMNDVKEISKQTASGNLTTVELIGKLMQYVTDLRNSVFELKLPE